MRKTVWFVLGALLSTTLISCGKPTGVTFTYDTVNPTPILGDKTNSEAYDYNSVIVNKIEGLRSDFAMGVDASMILKVEESGGVYYNQDGVEQDVFQIMADQGVNFFRVRIWNNPFDKYGNGYGGGDVNTDRAIEMALRAKAAGMNILVDLHYSDFWADPDTQTLPRKWATYDSEELVTAVETFTTEVLSQFKTSGIDVDAIQIGNEINGGMMWPLGKIDWSDPAPGYDYLSRLLKAGIVGAKAVNSEIYTIIHLANGGSKDEFNDFFTAIEARDVPYDIIGASYYPYYHGSLEALQANLDNVAVKFNKPVIIAEMSYGFTNESTAFAANTYSSGMEEAGKFLTSLQGQATAIHDVIEILSKVPNNLGLGIFYWEPAWLPVEGAGWATSVSGLVTVDGLDTWANQGLFSYSGKVLPSFSVFNKVRTSTTNVTEVAERVRTSSIDLTLNMAVNEQMPTTYSVETNLDAIRQMTVEWDAADVAQLDTIGSYTVHGIVMTVYEVVANVTVIENFVVDPGYELQGATDDLLAPWIIDSVTPAGEKVVKLNRKPQDVRTGTSDLNWYFGSEDFSFKVKQTISLGVGTYDLSTYIMAVAPGELAHSELYIYVKLADNTTLTKDMKDEVVGWGTPANYYKEANIPDIVITATQNVEIGIVGAAVAGAWGHVDDWTLVRQQG